MLRTMLLSKTRTMPSRVSEVIRLQTSGMDPVSWFDAASSAAMRLSSLHAGGSVPVSCWLFMLM